MTGNITATDGAANTKVAFKNCTSFTRCITQINDEPVETAENLDIIMPMHNSLEYSDNYADSSGSLCQFKRDEPNMNNGNIAHVTTAGSSSFKYKSSLLRNPTVTALTSVDDQIRIYAEIRKSATGKGDDYTTGCLLDYQYFKDHYQLIAVDLSKQKELDADPRTIQQIEFCGMLKSNSQVCTVLEKSKETVLEVYKRTAKVL